MTRPRKQTVDWFPHQCKHGATIFILESKYQADGYSFWFKLLEVLGSTTGHRVDCKEEKSFAYLCAYTKTTTEACIDRLDLLARMEAIDKELWNEGKVIWCQNFVDGIHAAYRNRQLPTPDRPSYERELPGLGGDSSVRNPQRKEGRKEGEEVEEERALKRFSPPTVEQVTVYCKENNYPINASSFVDYYISKGWKVGTSPMKNWQAAVRTWVQRESGKKKPTPAEKYAKGFNDRDRK